MRTGTEVNKIEFSKEVDTALDNARNGKELEESETGVDGYGLIVQRWQEFMQNHYIGEELAKAQSTKSEPSLATASGVIYETAECRIGRYYTTSGLPTNFFLGSLTKKCEGSLSSYNAICFTPKSGKSLEKLVKATKNCRLFIESAHSTPNIGILIPGEDTWYTSVGKNRGTPKFEPVKKVLFSANITPGSGLFGYAALCGIETRNLPGNLGIRREVHYGKLFDTMNTQRGGKEYERY